jgi:murein DD-endopeptidase MepM/ murein hydrolase activator NlpD
MKKSLLIITGILLVACNGLRTIKSVFTDVSPYEHYIESLKKAELLNASMAKEWLSAGKQVFDDSVIINVPFSESGYFEASTPEARSYRFSVKDGQVLTVNGAVKTQGEAKVFLDLFVRDEGEWEPLAYADSTLSITYEFTRNQECVLRLQPELLASAYYALNISITPVLINPVFGASNRSIGSFYGASRDNGKRLHEGVDIFATRGTPVIAPTDGFISRVGKSSLGGKVVWMRDNRRGHSYYFAHLDSQMVKAGMRVYQGHVLGLVGNTGNAKKTPPHLHFGIYQSGSKDPLYYIHKVEKAMASLPVDTGFQQKPFKVLQKKIDLMTGPSAKLPVKGSLERDTYVTVIGQSHDWFRIALPDNTEGYLLKKQVVPLEGGPQTKLDTTHVLLSEIRPDAIPIAVLKKDTAVEILARFGRYNYVITEKGNAGWLFNPASL